MTIQEKIKSARQTRFNSINFWNNLNRTQKIKVILLVWDEGLYYTPEYKQINISSKKGNELSTEFKSLLRRLI